MVIFWHTWGILCDVLGIFGDVLATFKDTFGQEAAVTPGLELRAAAERHARGEGGAFIGFVQVRFETNSTFFVLLSRKQLLLRLPPQMLGQRLLRDINVATLCTAGRGDSPGGRGGGPEHGTDTTLH